MSPLFNIACFYPIEKWRIHCRCFVSSSARPSASLTSAWPLWSCPPMCWGTLWLILSLQIRSLLQSNSTTSRKASVTLNAPSPHLFSVNHSSSPCLRRALLMGLTSNPHINDLHLDISGCEVRDSRSSVWIEVKERAKLSGNLIFSYLSRVAETIRGVAVLTDLYVIIYMLMTSLIIIVSEKWDNI